ncbi:MAG: hypothetical protein UCI89_11340 [[Clostridium] leptum]|nr:hypothetical protein [[Clostridium] leptum]
MPAGKASVLFKPARVWPSRKASISFLGRRAPRPAEDVWLCLRGLFSQLRLRACWLRPFHWLDWKGGLGGKASVRKSRPEFGGRRELMMKVFAVLSLYIVFALILGILAFVLKKRHTRFPDFTVGYHDKRVMENKEKWECANHTAGNLCAFFALVSAIASVLLYLVKASVEAMIILFFVLSGVEVLAVLIFPVRICKKFDRL